MNLRIVCQCSQIGLSSGQRGKVGMGMKIEFGRPHLPLLKCVIAMQLQSEVVVRMVRLLFKAVNQDLIILLLRLCFYVWLGECHFKTVEVREQLSGLGSFLPPCEFLGLQVACQTWWHVSLPAESFSSSQS